jgi:hypothetical protein
LDVLILLLASSGTALAGGGVMIALSALLGV